MKNVILLVIINLIPILCYSEDKEMKTLIDIQNRKIIQIEQTNQDLQKEINNLKVENSKLIVSIDYLKEEQAKQIIYYEKIISTIFWVVSLIFLLFNISFGIFIWLFKKPEELWKKLSKIKDDAIHLLDKLDIQVQHQKSLFIFGEKGLYSFTPEDWNIIKDFANTAKNEKEERRSANDWYFMGLWDYKQKKYPDAINNFKRAIELEKDFEIAYKDLGNAYEEINDSINAIKCYEKVLSINPLNSKTLSNLGLVYTTLKDFDKAIDYFNKSLKIDPCEGFTYTNVFELNLLLDKDFDSAIVDNFILLFKNNKKIFSTYEMLNVFKKITKGENVDLLLIAWSADNYKLGANESYKEIEKWINGKSDNDLKMKLQKALDFFKLNTEE